MRDLGLISSKNCTLLLFIMALDEHAPYRCLLLPCMLTKCVRGAVLALSMQPAVLTYGVDIGGGTGCVLRSLFG